MPETTQLDRTYDFILRTFIDRGAGPRYSEIASALGVSPDEGKKLLHDLMGTGMAMWLQPGADTIASFAPFNNFPGPYRVTVDGRQRWFAQ